jgi:FkbM family methyltransferase
MKALVQSLLRPLGLRLARVESEAKPEFGSTVLFTTLQKFGFSPRHILDVGANHGNWTRGSLAYFPKAQYTLLEPQDHLKVHIRDLIYAGYEIRWINAGASDQSGTLPFHVAQRDDSSTFAELHGDGISTTTLVNVKTLDDVISTYQLPVPEMVKIDAEGFDLKVLNGAKSLLGKTDIFCLEASVICPYENSAAKVVQLMDEHGYRLMDITELNRSPKHGVLWLTEFAFLRIGSPLLEQVTSYE